MTSLLFVAILLTGAESRLAGDGDRMFSRRLILMGVFLAVYAGSSCLYGQVPQAGSQAQAVILGRTLSAAGAQSPRRPPPSPMAGVKVTVTDVSDGKIAGTVVTGADGSFRIVVAPGDYSVSGVGDRHLVQLSPGQQLQIELYSPNP